MYKLYLNMFTFKCFSIVQHNKLFQSMNINYRPKFKNWTKVNLYERQNVRSGSDYKITFGIYYSTLSP